MKKILVLAAIGLAAGAANASVISEDITFSLSGFVDISGSTPPPISTITGSFTLTYDPTLSYDNDTADIVTHSFTGITLDSPIGFTYQGGYLEIGGIENDSDIVYNFTNDLVVSLNVSDPSHVTFIPCSTPGYTCGKYTGSPLVEAAGYTQADSSTAWFYGAPQSTVNPVPEPASWALLSLGLGALGFIARKRKV